jgi:hypothetical protein
MMSNKASDVGAGVASHQRLVWFYRRPMEPTGVMTKNEDDSFLLPPVVAFDV